MDAVVHLENAGVSLGGRKVLVGIDLTVPPGRCVGVVGPNGSGKTTLVRATATLLGIQSGSATILGVDLPARDLARLRREIGLIGHEPSLIPELTLTEYLEHAARLSGLDITRVPHALQVVGLGDAADRRARACSFGMRRRIEIAHLLLVKPRLLLLDEAASGLDDEARDLIAAVVSSVRDRDGGVMMVSHDRKQLTELCDEIFALESGRLVSVS